MKYELKCADSSQKSLFYSDCEPALRNACIGHVRMDFGSGSEFWTTWWGNREDMNDSAFKTELNEVVNRLRKDGLLRNRSEMQIACGNNSSLALGEAHGFSVETDKNIFLLRCQPGQGYDCYLYCYNKQELVLAQSQLQEQEQDEIQSPVMSL
ncbi:MAG TPA: hypothetical protein DDX91_01130 [Ruminococcaceae bacterium]|nr:hypothetical protein [Oscillospiraceae bacterium]